MNFGLEKGLLTQRPLSPDGSPDSGRGRYGAQTRNAKEEELENETVDMCESVKV